MWEVLNMGLKFAILPLKLDITQVLVDFRKYKRNLVWKEFFFKMEDKDKEYKPPVFKTNKTNFPKKYKSPEGLNIFIGATKSEILDPRNRNNVKCNISMDQILAIRELVSLQKQRQIIIKRCDKGAGIIILNFEEYVGACNAHLNSEITNADGSTSKYYMKVDKEALDSAKHKLNQILQEALDNDIISKTEAEAMDPGDKGPGKFYCTFKVHKEHRQMEVPPERPIISGCGSAFENVSKFINHHIQDISTNHPTYIQDTPDLLRYLE